MQDGQTTLYLRSSILGGQVIAEMNAQGSWTRGYVYGADGGLVTMQQPEGYLEWVTQDPVTKGQRITNSQGKVTAALEFDPFGGETSKSYNSYRQPQKYTTYTRDSNGTDDAMHRRYSGFWSRFQQPDPYDGSYDLTNPQSLNRYAYTQNDPVNFVDPSGLNMWSGGSGYGCDASYGSCGGGWDGTGGGGGGGGFGFSGGYFDSERFAPGSVAEAAYEQRLQNTRDGVAARNALNRGNYDGLAAILNGNPNVGLSVGGVSLMGQLGGAFASGYGRYTQIASVGVIDWSAAIKKGWENVYKLVSSLRGPDFLVVTAMAGGGFTRALARGDNLLDVPIIGYAVGPGAEVSLAFGWMLQLQQPDRSEVRAWLQGVTFTVSAFYKVGGGVVFPVNSTGPAGVFAGFGLGGKGAAGGFSFDSRHPW